jgi:hypothetical protein
MAELAKKKVSFDIDPTLLDDIKKYCAENKIKQSDFFRDSAREKLARDKDYLIILVPTDGTVKKFVIQKSAYDIDIFEASQEMKESVDATKEGVLRVNDNHSENININKELAELITHTGKIKFFVR